MRIANTRASKSARGPSILKNETVWDPTLLTRSFSNDHYYILWTSMPDIFTALNNAESWFPYPRLVLLRWKECHFRFSPSSSFPSPLQRFTFISPSVSWEERERRERQWRKRQPSQRNHLLPPSLKRPRIRKSLRVKSTTKPFAREKQLPVNKPASKGSHISTSFWLNCFSVCLRNKSWKRMIIGSVYIVFLYIEAENRLINML